MNKHIFFDNLTANIGALVSGSKKFFAESTNSLSFQELIRSIELSVTEINSEGTFVVRATGTIAGSLNTVALRNHILEVLQNSEKTKASINTSPERV